MSAPDQTPTRKAFNTLTQGLAYTLIAVVIVTLYAAFTTATSWGDLWTLITAWATFQAIGTALLTYLMREVVDKYRTRFGAQEG